MWQTLFCPSDRALLGGSALSLSPPCIVSTARLLMAAFAASRSWAAACIQKSLCAGGTLPSSVASSTSASASLLLLSALSCRIAAARSFRFAPGPRPTAALSRSMAALTAVSSASAAHPSAFSTASPATLATCASASAILSGNAIMAFATSLSSALVSPSREVISWAGLPSASDNCASIGILPPPSDSGGKGFKPLVCDLLPATAAGASFSPSRAVMNGVLVSATLDTARGTGSPVTGSALPHRITGLR